MVEPGASSGATWCWGAIGALACAAAAAFEPSMLEEGLPLHVAQRMLRGEQLYRDVVFFTGPLPFDLLAALFRIAGEHLFVARGAVVLLQGLATAAVFAIGARAGAGPLAHAAAAAQASAPWLLFPLFSIYFPSTLATILCPLAVLAALRGLDRSGWATVAGILTACVALCKQTTGAVLAAGLVVAIAACAPASRRVVAGGSFIAGGLAAALGTSLWYFAQGTVGDLVEATIWMPLALGDTFHMPFPALWPPGEPGAAVEKNWPFYLPRLYLIAKPKIAVIMHNLGLLTQLLYLLPMVALAITLLRAAWRGLPNAISLHTAILLAGIAGLFPRTDWGHLSMVLPAAVAQLLLVAGSRRGAIDARDPWRSALAGLLVAGFGLASAAAAVLIYGVAGHEPWDPKAPVLPVSEDYATPAVPRAIQYLREQLAPGEPLIVARQEPLLYFVLDARNPTRYVGMMQGRKEAQESELLAALPAVPYVVMSEKDGAATGYYSDELPAVYAHLERHYRIPSDFPTDVDQWLMVYQRAEDRGATAVDLVAAASGSPHWMKAGPDGPVIEYPASRLPRFAMRHLRRPLALMVAPDGGGIDVSLELPNGARFESGVALGRIASSEGIARRSEAGETYSVWIVDGGEAMLAASKWVPPDAEGERTWETIEADLSRWGGKKVVLRLQVVPDKAPKIVSTAWWGSPRIVAPAGSAEDRLDRTAPPAPRGTQ